LRGEGAGGEAVAGVVEAARAAGAGWGCFGLGEEVAHGGGEGWGGGWWFVGGGGGDVRFAQGGEEVVDGGDVGWEGC
jgi:hypothetical protein